MRSRNMEKKSQVKTGTTTEIRRFVGSQVRQVRLFDLRRAMWAARALGVQLCMRRAQVTPPMNPNCRYGNANTKIEFVAAGMRASGIVSVTMLLAQDPPPVPTGTAMYCFPFTAYVIGKPCTSVGMRGLV